MLRVAVATIVAVACCSTALAQTPSPATPPPRNVRISFLPPPLEGTISLGIYDATGKLVRVLHREADVSEFEIGADALHTTWDGKDDADAPLPPGKYHARGYMVGDLQADPEPIASATVPEPTNITVKLIANPLIGGKRPTVELAAGFDEDGTFLKTADGLPLYTVDELPDVFAVAVARRNEKALDFFQNDGDTVDHFRITRFEQMMPFDAGDFELK